VDGESEQIGVQIAALAELLDGPGVKDQLLAIDFGFELVAPAHLGALRHEGCPGVQKGEHLFDQRGDIFGRKAIMIDLIAPDEIGAMNATLDVRLVTQG
jgi:hypothetical protein